MIQMILDFWILDFSFGTLALHTSHFIFDTSHFTLI